MSKKVNGWYGWKPDKPDIRDFKYRVSAAVPLQEKVDLRSYLPSCYDQGNLGSCTANAIAAALEFDMRKQGEKRAATPSRLFIYYNERVMEGTVSEDSGAEIRDGIKCVNALGAPAEKAWPYDVKKFAKKPPASVFKKGMARQSIQYSRVDNTKIDDMRACLSSGFPIVFGFTVYDYFESEEMNQSGILRVPGPTEASVGGHAVLAVGYDNATKTFLVRNSWGTDWVANMGGNFWMPYDYISNPGLADDFWTIQSVE
jgi:C1A family cysteine protease